MSNIKMMMIWGVLLILFLFMIWFETQPAAEADIVQEDEVIYLPSYEEVPIVIEPKNHDLFPKDNTPIVLPLELGRLAVSSVVINKKSPVTPIDTSSIQGSSWSGDPQLHFLENMSNQVVATEVATSHDDLSYKIFQGQRLNAVLTHAINSDLAGMVVAEISQDAYGYHARLPLLPKGTRLIGVYNSLLNVGDERLYIVWQRAITPEGIDIALGSPGADRLGQSGASGVVDHHFWQIFGTSSLLSVMAVGASNLSGDEQGEFSNQYQQGVTDALVDTSRTILRGKIQRKPTIHIPQGEIVHVMVAKDLDFSSLKKKEQSIAIF